MLFKHLVRQSKNATHHEGHTSNTQPEYNPTRVLAPFKKWILHKHFSNEKIEWMLTHEEANIWDMINEMLNSGI